MLKIISTPSQFSSKEMPGEVEVLKVCATLPLGSLLDKASKLLPAMPVLLALPTGRKTMGSLFFWPHATPLQAKESPLRTRQEISLWLCPAVKHELWWAISKTWCYLHHRPCSEVYPFSLPLVWLRFRSPFWSAMPMTDGFSQHSSDGFFEHKPVTLISDKTSPIRSADLMQSCRD